MLDALPLHVLRHADRASRASARATRTIRAKVTADLRHLIVDEYQDVNPAQERLIHLLAKPHGTADLVVVGDDDQAIYQWRGSNVDNIVTFADRYDGVTQFNLLVNRRSRPDIVAARQRVRPDRSPTGSTRRWGPFRAGDGPAVSIAIGHDDEQTEADAIALDIEALHDQGVPLPRHRDPRARHARPTRRSSTRSRSRASRSSPADAPACSSSPRRRSSARRSRGSPTSTGRRAASSSARRSSCSRPAGRLPRDVRPRRRRRRRRCGRTSSSGSEDEQEPPDWDVEPGRRVLRAAELLRIAEWDLTDVHAAQPARHRRPTIGLGLGSNASGSTRRLKDAGTNFLTSEIYQDSGRSTMWGSGANVLTPAAAPSKAARNFTAYGRVTANQDVPAGSYTDTVVATVNF